MTVSTSSRMDDPMDDARCQMSQTASSLQRNTAHLYACDQTVVASYVHRAIARTYFVRSPQIVVCRTVDMDVSERALVSRCRVPRSCRRSREHRGMNARR